MKNSVSSNYKVKFKAKGFTLVEIMVAVAILGFTSIALILSVGQATSDVSRLNQKLVALSLADYALNSVLVKEEFPELGSNEDIIVLGEDEWLVSVTVSETPNNQVRRIDAMVRPKGEILNRQIAATVLLSGFRADIYE